MTTQPATAERVPEVREQIVLAARDLLAEHGLAGVSMRGVAERVGVSATALYHYFDNKDALVREVVEWGFQEFGRYLEASVRAHPSGSLERVRALGEGYIRFALEHQAYFRILFSIQRPEPGGIADLPEGGGYELLRQTLEEGMEAGTIRRADPDLMAMHLWAGVHGLVMISFVCRFDEGSECGPQGIVTSPIDLFRAFGEFVRHGIAAPDPHS